MPARSEIGFVNGEGAEITFVPNAVSLERFGALCQGVDETCIFYRHIGAFQGTGGVEDTAVPNTVTFVE